MIKYIKTLSKWWNKPSETYPDIKKFDKGYSHYCGVKRLKVGDFIFSPDCYEHDKDYHDSYTYKQKFVSDWNFLVSMVKRSLKQKSFIKKTFYVIIALIFFLIVSTFGVIAFKPVRNKMT